MDDRPSTGTVARGEAILTVLAAAGAATPAVGGARTGTNEAAVSDEAAAAAVVVEAAEALAATGEVMELDGERYVLSALPWAWILLGVRGGLAGLWGWGLED